MKRIIIFGTGDFAAMASIYFERDYNFSVAGFTVESTYKQGEYFRGKRVVEMDSVVETFPPTQYDAFVAVAYQKMNRERLRLVNRMKESGYKLLSYISPYSYVEKGVKIGENSFVFENNTLQYGVKIGDNTIIWSGNHIGHSTIVGSNVYIASHVCISGDCKIGDNCFLGVNSSVADNVTVPNNTLIAMGSALTNSFDKEGRILAGVPAKELKKKAYEYFEVEENEN